MFALMGMTSEALALQNKRPFIEDVKKLVVTHPGMDLTVFDTPFIQQRGAYDHIGFSVSFSIVTLSQSSWMKARRIVAVYWELLTRCCPCFYLWIGETAKYSVIAQESWYCGEDAQ